MVNIRLLTGLEKDVVRELLVIINPAYVTAESGIWKKDIERVKENELLEMINQKQVVVALLNDEIVATGRVEINNNIGDIGVLACKENQQGNGIGTQLLQYCEQIAKQRGCTTTQVCVLHPQDNSHAGKRRIIAWYIKNGYHKSHNENFEQLYPTLSPNLAVPCLFSVFQKSIK